MLAKGIVALVFFASCEARTSFSIVNNTADSVKVMYEQITSKDSLFPVYYDHAMIRPHYTDSPLPIAIADIDGMQMFYVAPLKTCVIAETKDKDEENIPEFIVCKKMTIIKGNDTISGSYKEVKDLFNNISRKNNGTSYELILDK